LLTHECIIKQSITSRIKARRRVKGKNPIAGKEASPVAGGGNPFGCPSAAEEATENERGWQSEDICCRQSPMGESQRREVAGETRQKSETENECRRPGQD
jgi:hypothetical protein